MKLRFLAISLIALFVAASTRADGYSFKDLFSRSGAFNPSGQVVLDNVNGDVEIRTWDKNEILIEGEKSAKTTEELQLIDLNIELSDARATIKVRLPKRKDGLFSKGTIRASVRFTVTVPATCVLENVSTVNGTLAIDGVRGAVNASTVNGNLRGSHLGGAVDFRTVNGNIKAGLDVVASEQMISAETVNGSIALRLPKDAGVQLKSSTVNGDIDCHFPVESTREQRKKKLHGRIGDGRASLEADTVNGSILIESQ